MPRVDVEYARDVSFCVEVLDKLQVLDQRAARSACHLTNFVIYEICVLFR